MPFLALITMLILLISAIILAIVHSGGYDNSKIAEFFGGLSWVGIAFVCVMTIVLKFVLKG